MVGALTTASWPQAVQGEGLIATADIARGDLLLSVPAELCLTAPPSCDDGSAEVHEGHRLCLRLLNERCRGTASQWHDWLASLPTAFDTPVHWPAAELEARLRCPSVLSRAREERENLDLLLEALDEEDQALYRWAYSTVQSRAFVVRERHTPQPTPPPAAPEMPARMRAALARRAAAAEAAPACDGGVCPSCDGGAAGAARRRWALVPVADLFNHAHGGPVAVGYDGEADAYTYHAAAPIAQGAEVMLQYGARDNASLLLQYGFTLRDNPHGSLPFALSDRGDAGPRLPAPVSKKQRVDLENGERGSDRSGIGEK